MRRSSSLLTAAHSPTSCLQAHTLVLLRSCQRSALTCATSAFLGPWACATSGWWFPAASRSFRCKSTSSSFSVQSRQPWKERGKDEQKRHMERMRSSSVRKRVVSVQNGELGGGRELVRSRT
mmetsp:Transcript_17640/g.58102  ORF Transcript_17640/g.58102 Transcript_17640/m.58102 type:complete len:122 (-) Transcript_17640:141-506(-)